MYSSSWFDTFSRINPADDVGAEAAAIASHVPLPEFRRILELGCGTGRVVCPLHAMGYDVTGLDISVPALQLARHSCPGGRFVALDQRHVGRLKWTFDAALVLWNSIGFGSVEEDRAMLADLYHVLRPGGRLLLDLYNPAWLARNNTVEKADPRGATITRQLLGQRLQHTISYARGGVDRIEFNVYDPPAVHRILVDAGFDAAPPLVWWKPASIAATHARYQIIATVTQRTPAGG